MKATLRHVKITAAVRHAALAKRDSKDALVADDVKSLSVLQIRDPKVKDLRGLENCVALLQFDLAGTEVSDIGPLKALVLTLSRNRIKDLAPLAGMNRLQYLELTGNQVTDISAGNQIVDLAPVTGLTWLWSIISTATR